MAVDDIFMQELSEHKESLTKFQEWLRKIFYAGDTLTFLNQARINIMMTGASFLVDNLDEIKVIYQTHR